MPPWTESISNIMFILLALEALGSQNATTELQNYLLQSNSKLGEN